MRHLERLPLGTSYPRIVERVKALLARPPLSSLSTILLIDYAGVGRPVDDLFQEAGLEPVGVGLTGGNEVHPTGVGDIVPKRDLAAAAQAVLPSGRLRITERVRDAQTLRNELIRFQIKVNLKTGHDSYEAWREKGHDDLVLATALAVWFREWYGVHYDSGWSGVYDRNGRRIA